jgi:hypothetical protein
MEEDYMTGRTLTATEVDTIRVALALLSLTPARFPKLQQARAEVGARSILNDGAIVRLGEELAPGSNPANAVQLRLTIGQP